MNRNYIIIEEAYIPESKPIIISDKKIGDNKYKLIFKTILQEADVLNNNKRIYPKEVLQIVANQLQSKAKNRALFGELDHPWVESNDTELIKRRASQVRLSRICVLYRDIKFDGKYIIAECETLTNTKGLDFYALLKDEANIGFSLRAFGPVTPNGDGTVTVGRNIKAITYDVVSNPSHQNARILEFLPEESLIIPSEYDYITEDTNNTISIKEDAIILPLGTIVNDVNDDELQSLINNDNISSEYISISYDSDSKLLKICRDNVCVYKYVDDVADFLTPGVLSTLSFRRVFPKGICKLLSLSYTLSTPTINNTNDIPDDSVDNDIDTIDNTYDQTIESVIFNTLNDENAILELLDSEFANNDSKIYEFYEKLAARYKLDPEEIFIEDYFDFETFDDITSATTVTEEEIDYIDDDNFEYSPAPAFKTITETLSYIYDINKDLFEINENELISKYKQQFEEAIDELNSIPSILYDLTLEDEKYNPKSQITTLLNNTNITEEEVDILLNHLIQEEYNELRNLLPDLKQHTFDSIFYTYLFFDN